MVSTELPAVILPSEVKVIVEVTVPLALGVTEAGLKPAEVTWLGSVLMLRVTAELKLATLVTVTV
jgi:hypothetical protein